MHKKYCPNCGNEVHVSAIICPVCGAPIPHDENTCDDNETPLKATAADDEATHVVVPAPSHPDMPDEAPTIPPAPRVTPSAPRVTPSAPPVAPSAPRVAPSAPHVTPSAPRVAPSAPRVTPSAPRVTPSVAAASSRYAAQQPSHSADNGYEDEKPQRRTRWGIIIPVVILVLALLGAGGYFGYMYYSESQTWSKISSSYDLKDFKEYLDKYPFGSHRDEAQTKYNTLKEEYDAWEEAEKESTFDDFREFVHDYPDSHLCAKAKEKMDSVAWADAMHEDTPDAYRFYVERMPKGKHVKEAEAKAENMQLRELTEYERREAIDAVEGVFSDIEYGNTDQLLARFPAEFKFMGKAATKVTLFNYVEELRKDVYSLSITVSNCKVTKEVSEDRNFTYSVDFNVDYHCSRYVYNDYLEDYNEEDAFISNTGTAIVDSNQMIRSLTICRVAAK